MTLNTKELFEWIGGAAIIVSLLLVAYEIRQNTNAVSAQAFYDLNQHASTTMQLIATNEEFAMLFKKGDTNPDDLTELELFRYRSAVYADMNLYEAAYFYFEKGIIEQREYEAYLATYCDEMQLPGYKKTVEELGHVHLGAFFESANAHCASLK